MVSKVNYDKIMENMIAKVEGKPTLLLHSCCGPCSTSVVERLVKSFRVTIFFYNPNIDDPEEYTLRKNTQIDYLKARYGASGEVDFMEGDYDVHRFQSVANPWAEEPEGGRRCEACFRMRLAETFRRAVEGQYAFLSTTLTVSPMKDAQCINEIARELSIVYGENTTTKYLFSDFKKKGGYGRSIEISKEYGLYRQHFCGCRYSRR